MLYTNRSECFWGEAKKGTLGEPLKIAISQLPAALVKKWNFLDLIQQLMRHCWLVRRGLAAESDLQRIIEQGLADIPRSAQEEATVILRRAREFGCLSDEQIRDLIQQGGWKD